MSESTTLREAIARALHKQVVAEAQSRRIDIEVHGEGIAFERRLADAVLAVLDDHDAKVRAEALREAADAFEGGAINVEVFRGGLEVVYWRAANKTRRSIVSSLRARADRIERGEPS